MGDWPNFGRGFSVVHLNARSIRNKKASLRNELDRKQIDVLLFSETFLNELDDDFQYLICTDMTELVYTVEVVWMPIFQTNYPVQMKSSSI